MEKYSRYYGLIIFVIVTAVSVFLCYNLIKPKMDEVADMENNVSKKESILKEKQKKFQNVKNKIEKIKASNVGSVKKIYYPIESDLGNDSLFFTLYNDLIEMVHSNSIKIKSINYTYNPASDEFVKFGKDVYFVCDVDMDLVSNYVNLGKLIQDLYQYPYYVKINEVDVKPYAKDKKILLTKLSVRLYAHTEPEKEIDLTMPVLPKV